MSVSSNFPIANSNHLNLAPGIYNEIVVDNEGSIIEGSFKEFTYQQLTKLGVIGSTANPRVVDIEINTTETFCKPPIEVIKFIAGDTNKVITICEFNNADSSDFEENNDIEFDGTMHFKTKYDIDTNEPIALGTNGYLVESAEVDFSKFLNVSEVSIL